MLMHWRLTDEISGFYIPTFPIVRRQPAAASPSRSMRVTFRPSAGTPPDRFSFDQPFVRH